MGALVLLAIDDDEVRARFAYQLATAGFEVAVAEAKDPRPTAPRPDVIVAALSVGRPTDPHLRGIPVVAVTDDTSDTTRDRARQEGCAAVCVNTCSGTALGAGIRALLHREPELDRSM
jgi:DNA-binding response OmpR family regulator